MTITVKHYNELTKDELYDLIALRVAVFVVEQNCPYQDLDGLDKDAFHVLIKLNHAIIATARILKPGMVYTEVAIGRVSTSSEHRKLKLGHQLMKTCMHFIATEMKENAVRLSAQSHLKNYYAKHGFVATGKDYLEDGIPHSEMLFQQ